MVPLPAFIDPDWDQRKQGKALLHDPEFISANHDGIIIATQDTDIQYRHAHQLASKAPPSSPPEEMPESFAGNHCYIIQDFDLNISLLTP